MNVRVMAGGQNPPVRFEQDLLNRTMTQRPEPSSSQHAGIDLRHRGKSGDLIGKSLARKTGSSDACGRETPKPYTQRPSTLTPRAPPLRT